MLRVLPAVASLEAWSGTVQNGMSCMVTHTSGNAQSGIMTSATDDQNNVHHQPSATYERTIRIPCEHPVQANHNDRNNNNDNNNGNINVKNCRKNVLVENLVGKWFISSNHPYQVIYEDHFEVKLNKIIKIFIDTTVLIIDGIWYNFPVHLNSQVIPIRLFVQETLRRSRTSWSTLQTALFYLIKIKPQITFLWLNPDRWTLNSKDNNNQGSDPATCGRRMFLASLIIASKYLQDRNYANNAWSKICGLPVQEINAIERRFLKLIDYNLFIGEEKYKHWTSSLRSHIQAIKGSEVTAENRKAVAQFEQTLQQPQVVECKVQC